MAKRKNSSQITGHYRTENLTNIWREDVVETDRQFSQLAALANTRKTHDGYFVVARILEEKDA